MSNKEFMKVYHMPFKAQEIKDDNSTNFKLQFDQAFEEMTKSFAEQQDEMLLNYLYEKYKDTKVSDVWVLSKPDFEKFLLEMLPKWKYGNNFKDSKEVKIEIPESGLMDYNPVKNYLKWEDLDFKEEEQTMKVLLNGKEYMLSYFTDGIYNYIDLLTDNMRYPMGRYVDCYSYEKQFFNDLHLERVEE